MEPQSQQQPMERSQEDRELVKDPVCGMEVEKGQSEGGQAVHDGKTYDFCSADCRDKFESNPGAYVAPH